jgi:hypothetical protein
VLKDNPLKSISLESESWIIDGDENAVLLYEYVVE